MRENPIPEMRTAGQGRLYTLDVKLVSGPVSERFLEENPVVSRSIQLRGDQTLEDLHDAIFTAFDREDDNAYEFRVGRGPRDPEERFYVLPSEMSSRQLDCRNIAGSTRTKLEALDLTAGQTLTYWFDFDDEWLHQVAVSSVENGIPRGKFPRVVSRVGESPAQYDDMEDDESNDALGYAMDEEWNMSY